MYGAFESHFTFLLEFSRLDCLTIYSSIGLMRAFFSRINHRPGFKKIKSNNRRAVTPLKIKFMNTFVTYFFLIVGAIWIYRLLSYFYGNDTTKTSKSYKVKRY